MSTANERATTIGEFTGQREPAGIPQLHHVNLKTTRKDAMVSWYQSVLCMEVLADHPAVVFLSNDLANHRIALFTIPGIVPDENRIHHDGLHHLAFEYSSFEELNAVYLRLRDKGIVPEVCLDHGFTLSYYYADPDNNLVELQVDTFGNWEASRAWTVQELLKQEFLAGALVDPAKIAIVYKQGMSFEEIHTKANAGGFSPGELPDFRLPLPPPDAPPLMRI